MLNEIRKVKENADLLYSEQEVESALNRMADEINCTLEGTDPVVLCVLNGGIVAAGRLLTRLTLPLTVDSVIVSRYQNKTQGADLEWRLKPNASLQNKTVLVIDDILDEGITLRAIVDYCWQHGAQAVYTAVLVDKNIGRTKPLQADFVGVNTENRYLFGYGMDYKGYLRNSAGIFACQENVE